MTRNVNDGQKQHSGGNDNQAEGIDFTDKEVEQLGAREGRGDRQVPGAEASDEYVAKHVDGMSEQGPDLLDPEHPTKKEKEV